MPTHSYICPSPGDTADAQAATVRAAGLTPDEEFRDDGDDTWRLPLRDREAGKKLLARLAPGDVVVIATPMAVSATLSGYGAIAGALHEIGVDLRLAGAPATCAPGGKGLQAVITSAERPRGSLGALPKAEQIRAGLAYAKASGRRTSTHPPIGFKWVQRGRHWQVKPDPYELRVIERIVRWRQENKSSWAEIARHLLRHKVKTSSGLDWTVRRIRRAFLLATGDGRFPLPTK